MSMAKSSKKSERAKPCSQAKPWHLVSYMINGPQCLDTGTPQANKKARKKENDHSAQMAIKVLTIRR